MMETHIKKTGVAALVTVIIAFILCIVSISTDYWGVISNRSNYVSERPRELNVQCSFPARCTLYIIDFDMNLERTGNESAGNLTICFIAYLN